MQTRTDVNHHTGEETRVFVSPGDTWPPSILLADNRLKEFALPNNSVWVHLDDRCARELLEKLSAALQRHDKLKATAQ